jgi:hypothetical protein
MVGSGKGRSSLSTENDGSPPDCVEKLRSKLLREILSLEIQCVGIYDRYLPISSNNIQGDSRLLADLSTESTHCWPIVGRRQTPPSGLQLSRGSNAGGAGFHLQSKVELILRA